MDPCLSVRNPTAPSVCRRTPAHLILEQEKKITSSSLARLCQDISIVSYGGTTKHLTHGTNYQRQVVHVPQSLTYVTHIYKRVVNEVRLEGSSLTGATAKLRRLVCQSTSCGRRFARRSCLCSGVYAARVAFFSSLFVRSTADCQANASEPDE